jgi:hypothetical protein
LLALPFRPVTAGCLFHIICGIYSQCVMPDTHESPRRKRAGYQNGLKSKSYLGGHVVSPQTPLPRAYPTASGWGIKKIIINLGICKDIVGQFRISREFRNSKDTIHRRHWMISHIAVFDNF